MLSRRVALFFTSLSLAIVSPGLRAADVHFDYTSFDNPNTPGITPHFGQAQFNVLNYPSINGNYMMTSTDAHRPDMTANGNTLAEFYNFLQDRYDEQTTKDGAAAADKIDQYVISNSTNNGAKPTWIVLNEISAGTWPSNQTYRTWVVNVATRLHDTYGYNVVTYAPFANPGNNAADWQALAAKSYIGVENYLSGAGVMSHGTDYASRLAWATAQYAWSKTAYGNLGVSASRLFLGEDYANTASTYTDSKGTHTTTFGRAGISASDWDTVLQIRQDAIFAANYPGFLAYGWGSNAMLISEAEQIEHEYYYRSRLVMQSQQPQWLSDGSINVNGTLIPLSWAQPLNWMGGVPDASGAVANLYETNTAGRTITLDGAKTIGTLSFNSPNSYTINPGTGGTLTLNNAGSSANLAVTQGTHTIAVPVALAGNATFNIAGTLSLTAGFSSTTTGTITRTGTGTLNMSGTQTHAAGETFLANAGTTTFNSDSAGLAVTVNAATVNFAATQKLGALTVNTGGKANSTGSASTINAATLAITGGKLDLADDAMVIRSGTLGSPTSNIYNGLTGLIQSGRNSGAWNGNGIITSMTAAKSPSVLTTLAIAKASDALNLTGSQTKTWRGQTVDANAILIMYTYAGDANLDGKINADDYFQIDSNQGKPASGASYFHGDFNYDSKINGDDYFIIDSNFAAHGTPFSSSPALEAPIAVPEVSGVVSAMAGLSLLSARRHRPRA